MSSNKPTLSDFFKAVDRRIDRMKERGETGFQVRVGEKVIELRFTSVKNAQTAARFMVGIIPKKTDVPDAVFNYWNDDCSNYLPADANNTGAVWQSRDDTGYMRLSDGFNMVGVDYSRNRYYFCRQPSEATEYMLYGHAMVLTFGQWAARNGMLLLHSACVGVNGKGVMISARGGEGKSTLAVSCLMGGFDFVADDALLVNQKGPLKAMPLYRTVGLNQDMNAVLKPDMPVVYKDPRRNDKLLLDASRFMFTEQLPVHAIMYPRVTDAPQPSVKRIAPGTVLAKLIDSTATLIGVFRDPEIYRLMAKRLLGVPVYEIMLSKDIVLNREFLKNFIIKEL